MVTVHGASNRMICQRSTGPGFCNSLTKNGGAWMPFIQRVTVTIFSPWVTSNGASATASLPMLEPCTKVSWVRSIRLSTTRR